MARSTLGLLTALIILGGLGVVVYLRLQPEPDETEEAREMSDAEAQVVESVQQQFNSDVPTPVEGVPVVKDTLRIYASAPARAEAFREVKVLAQVGGIVQRVRVRENQRVGTNELLIRIDTTEYALDLDERRAAHERALIDYQVTLIQDEVLEDPELREMRASRARITTGLAQAEVALKRSELNMLKTAVRAPFGGRIADLKVVEGQHVGAGTELLTVMDIDPIKVSISALETAVVNLEEGRAASMVFAALPDTMFSGTIETINPVVDLETTSARVTVLLPNPDGRIRPGMHAEARLEVELIPDLTLVPRTSVRETPDRRSHIFIFKDGRADWRYITQGRMNDVLVEVHPSSQHKVDPGEIVLVDGHQSIIHDGAVRLVENVDRAGGRPTR